MKIGYVISLHEKKKISKIIVGTSHKIKYNYWNWTQILFYL